MTLRRCSDGSYTVVPGNRRGAYSTSHKTAFYDQRADHYRAAIKDGETAIYDLGERARNDYEGSEEVYKRGCQWLSEHFPQWEDDMAYWD